MTRTVLIVDDTKSVQVLLTDFLTGQGFAVLTASDGVEAVRQVAEHKVDIILLDIMMPNMDGYQFISRLRKESQIPVIMITAKQHEADLIRGFDLGTDDYLTKPFRMRELLVRMRAVLRRTELPEGPEALLSAGEVVLDRGKHEVTVAGQAVELTPLEFQILEILMLAGGQVVHRAALSTRLIELGYTGSEATIKIHIRNIRNKIEKDPNQPQIIETVFGVGYRLGGAA
ncbi:MAG TPA: response regulator transcription factor [Anaerolineaceae bacterium]